MKDSLHNQDINILFKYKGETQEIQGISFTKGKYSFKGSAIDRSFSYAEIDHQIKENISIKQEGTTKQILNSPLSDQKIIQNKILSNLANYLDTMGSIAQTIINYSIGKTRTRKMRKSVNY